MVNLKKENQNYQIKCIYQLDEQLYGGTVYGYSKIGKY